MKQSTGSLVCIEHDKVRHTYYIADENDVSTVKEYAEGHLKELLRNGEIRVANLGISNGNIEIDSRTDYIHQYDSYVKGVTLGNAPAQDREHGGHVTEGVKSEMALITDFNNHIDCNLRCNEVWLLAGSLSIGQDTESEITCRKMVIYNNNILKSFRGVKTKQIRCGSSVEFIKPINNKAGCIILELVTDSILRAIADKKYEESYDWLNRINNVDNKFKLSRDTIHKCVIEQEQRIRTSLPKGETDIDFWGDVAGFKLSLFECILCGCEPDSYSKDKADKVEEWGRKVDAYSEEFGSDDSVRMAQNILLSCNNLKLYDLMYHFQGD